MAKNMMKQIANKKRTKSRFLVGELVFLELQSYRQTSIALKQNIKLNPRYYRPYNILQKVGAVAYKL